MPVIYETPLYPNQVGWNGQQAVTTQLNLRQMLNQVTSWNPSVDPEWAARWINDAYRKVIDMRQWYGLKVRGQINIPNTINVGQAVATQGSNIIQGIGTTWTEALVGLQFRIGFTYPFNTVTAVNVGLQQLTLDVPFGGQSITGGYNIFQVYVTLGANIKRLLWARNQLFGWPMLIDEAEQTINVWDTWRTNIGWSTVFATLPPTPDGQMQWEIWPAPYNAQIFPFEAWTQPPDMILDTDCPAPFIRSDLLVTRAVANALVFGGRTSKYYDPTTAQMMIREFNENVEAMSNADNCMDQQDVTYEYGFQDGRIGFGAGSTWAQSHDA